MGTVSSPHFLSSSTLPEEDVIYLRFGRFDELPEKKSSSRREWLRSNREWLEPAPNQCYETAS
jgi:hypothetical protein